MVNPRPRKHESQAERHSQSQRIDFVLQLSLDLAELLPHQCKFLLGLLPQGINLVLCCKTQQLEILLRRQVAPMSRSMAWTTARALSDDTLMLTRASYSEYSKPRKTPAKQAILGTILAANDRIGWMVFSASRRQLMTLCVQLFFGGPDRDEVQLLFNFILMQSIYLGFARQDARPNRGKPSGRRSARPTIERYANFLRRPTTS